jgi:hypothetical protein
MLFGLFCSNLAKFMNINTLKSITTDWFGEAVPGNPHWSLRLSETALTLRGVVSAPPICIPEDREGVFVERLWEGDVVELFLLNPKTGFYIEFNLGPRGAWWCCTFDSPRKRTPYSPSPLPGVLTQATPTERGRDGTLVIPAKSLSPELAFDPGATTGNVAFCLGAPQQFCTVADLGAGLPDFHRPHKWISLGMLLI